MNSNQPIKWRGDYMALFGLLHRRRKEMKLTQDQAGEIIGMSGRSYRDIENGHKDITAENLFRLAAALGVRVFDPAAEKKRKDASGFVRPGDAADDDLEGQVNAAHKLRRQMEALPGSAFGEMVPGEGDPLFDDMDGQIEAAARRRAEVREKFMEAHRERIGLCGLGQPSGEEAAPAPDCSTARSRVPQ